MLRRQQRAVVRRRAPGTRAGGGRRVRERGRAARDNASLLADVLRALRRARRAYLDEHVAPDRPNPDALRVFNEGIENWDMRPELSRDRRADARADRRRGLHLRTGVRRGHRGRGRERGEGRDRGLRPLLLRRGSRALPPRGHAIHDLTREATDAIRRGELVILPTDTVYGLAATAVLEEPVRALYRLKGRAATTPSALLAPDLGAALRAPPRAERPGRGDRAGAAPGAVHARAAEPGSPLRLADRDDTRRDRRPRPELAGADGADRCAAPARWRPRARTSPAARSRRASGRSGEAEARGRGSHRRRRPAGRPPPR